MPATEWWKIRPTPNGNQSCKLCGDLMNEGETPYCWRTATPISVSEPGKPLPCFSATPTDVPDGKVFNLDRAGIRPMRIIDEMAAATLGQPGLVIAKYHHSIPDFPELKEDVLRLVRENPGSDVTLESHGTNWTNPHGYARQYNILSSHGDYSNQNSGGLTIYGKAFPEPNEYPYLNEFVQRFPHTVNMRINVFGEKSGLSQHKESTILRQKDGRLGIKARFHLPIQTNPNSFVFLNGEIHHLEEGYLYFFNNGAIHSSFNEGDEARIHIVFDMLVTNKVLKELFFDYSIPAPIRYDPIDPDAPMDGPLRWDGAELIHLFDPQ